MNTTDQNLLVAAAWGNVSEIERLLAAGANIDVRDAAGETPLMLAVWRHMDDSIIDMLLHAGADVNVCNKKGWTPLMVASQWPYSRNNSVERLIEAGADVNARTKKGWTPLMIATLHGDKYTRQLLAAGAHINVAANNGFTTLMVAASKGHEEVVRALLAAGANVNAVDDTGQTALMQAASTGHVESMKLLLDAGADINASTAHGQTALMLAALQQRVHAVRLLLEHGADARAADLEGKTALQWVEKGMQTVMQRKGAAARGRPTEFLRYGEVAALLKAAGEADGLSANTVKEIFGAALLTTARRGYVGDAKCLIAAGADVNAVNRKGKSVLMVAAMHGKTRITRLLLDAGADVNATEPHGWTALMLAARCGHADCINELVRAGANIHAADHDGWMALHIAARENRTGAVRALLQAGADINACGRKKLDRPLIIAARCGHTNVVRHLLRAGANVRAPGNKRRTALMAARRNDIVRLLLKAGAPVNARDKNGWTALMVAASKGHVAAVLTLLAAGATTEAIHPHGITALMCAAWHGKADIVRLLLAAGSDPNACSNDGKTAFSIALKKGHTNIADDYLGQAAQAVLTPPILTILPEKGSPFLWIQRGPSSDGDVGPCLCDSDWWVESLPFSERLLQKIFAWYSEWGDVFDKYPEPDAEDVAQWDWLAFHARGLQLARWLKEEVGTAYRVVYEKPYEDPNDEWEGRMEILADGSLAMLPPHPLPQGWKKPPRFCTRIISGGQTGADRAALDFAIRLSYPHGGFAPHGRLAEDGRIPLKYQLWELPEGEGYRQRTRRNVEESDGTLIVNTGELDGGTLATQEFAQKLDRPYLVVQLDSEKASDAAMRALAWMDAHAIKTLNVAGPRESKRPYIWRRTARLLLAMHRRYGGADARLAFYD